MLYYLLYDPRNDRSIIASFDQLIERFGLELKDTTEAGSWVEAKKNFAYPLTPLQESMLDSMKRKRT